MICKHCGSMNLWVRGTNKSKNKITKRYECQECGKYSSAPSIPKVGAKILLLDIETSLMEFYGFSPYTNYISSELLIKDWCIVCWNAKWIFDSEIIGEKLTPQEVKDRQDGRILGRLWKLMDTADIIIHQNGRKFDIPRINFRFLLSGFPEPSYYQQIDTLEIMKKKFGASYNTQDFLTKTFGIQYKDEMHLADWISCMEGTEKSRRVAIQKMFDYNKNDVVGLEELYLYIRPWISSHANLGLYVDTDKDCCPNCGSTELKWSGQYATPLGLYDAGRCISCNALFRSTKKKYKIKKVDVRN